MKAGRSHSYGFHRGVEPSRIIAAMTTAFASERNTLPAGRDCLIMQPAVFPVTLDQYTQRIPEGLPDSAESADFRASRGRVFKFPILPYNPMPLKYEFYVSLYWFEVRVRTAHWLRSRLPSCHQALATQLLTIADSACIAVAATD